MKILMALMQLDIGGAETHVLELSKFLKLKGFEIYVASNGGKYVKELEKYGIVHYKVPLHNKYPHNMLKSKKMLKNIILENNIDIVHAHARIPAFICGILHKKMDFEFVTTAHWVFTPKFPFNLLSNWGEKTLAVSGDIKQYLIDNYKIQENNIYVSVNGIDINTFKKSTVDDEAKLSAIKKEFGIKDDLLTILTVSRLDTDRSLVANKLIAATEALEQEGKKVQLVIVGDGNDLANLKAKAELAKNKNNIIFTGFRTDVDNVVKLADIFVNVSRAALEAMACEVPLILAGNEGYIGVLDDSNLDIAIKTNLCCRGCEQITTDKLINDINKLCSMTKEQREEMGRNLREIVKSKYSLDSTANQVIDFYKAPIQKESNIVVLGYYGYKNHGDDALLKGIVENVRELKPDIGIKILSKQPEDTKRIYNADAISRYNIIEIKKAFGNADVLVLGGGTLIQDVTSTQSLIYYLAIIKLAQKMKVRIMLYSNGITINKKFNKKITKRVLSKVDKITLRDEDSHNLANELGLSKSKVEITADVAYALKVTTFQTDILKKLNIENKKYFVCSVRNWKKEVNDDFVRKFSQVMKEKIQKYNYKIVFLAMQQNADEHICKTLIDEIGSGVLMKDFSTDEALNVLQNAEFTIAMRLHTVIFSAIMNTPIVSIAYDIKVKSAMEMLNQPYNVELENLDYAKFSRYIDDVIENKEQISQSLHASTEPLHDEARRNATLLLELLNKKKSEI